MTLLALLLQTPGHMQAAPPPQPPPPPPFPLLALADRLGLSAEQTTSIRAVLDRHRESLQTKHRAAQSSREAMHQAMGNPALSAAELEGLARKEADAHRAEMMEAHQALQEAAKVLTPAQLASYQTLRATLPPPPGRGPDGGAQEGMHRPGRRGPGQGFEGGPGQGPSGAPGHPRPEGPGEERF